MAMFIRVDIDESVQQDADLRDRLAEVCPGDIFTIAGEGDSARVETVEANLDECTLQSGKKVYLIGKGRLANLVAAEGHPPEVMAQSFSNQLSSVMYILENHQSMGNEIMYVPESIDGQVAVDALEAMGVKIDSLSRAQARYAESW